MDEINWNWLCCKLSQTDKIHKLQPPKYPFIHVHPISNIFQSLFYNHKRIWNLWPEILDNNGWLVWWIDTLGIRHLYLSLYNYNWSDPNPTQVRLIVCIRIVCVWNRLTVCDLCSLFLSCLGSDQWTRWSGNDVNQTKKASPIYTGWHFWLTPLPHNNLIRFSRTIFWFFLIYIESLKSIA